LLLASLLLAPNFANAEPSLAEAIKKLDAKYLSVPDLAAKDAAPKIEAAEAPTMRNPPRRRSRKAACRRR
jgi:hypothetical protein